MKTRTLVLLAASAVALSACGLRGDLERPAPMWGSPQDPADDGAASAPPDPNAPVPTVPPQR